MADRYDYFDSVTNKSLFFKKKVVINAYYLELELQDRRTWRSYWTNSDLRKLTLIVTYPAPDTTDKTPNVPDLSNPKQIDSDTPDNITPKVFVNHVIPVLNKMSWELPYEGGKFAAFKIRVEKPAKVLVIEEKEIDNFDEERYRAPLKITYSD